MFKKFSFLYFPTLVLYLFACFFVFYFANYERAWNHAVTSTLSRYMPVPKYWRDFNFARGKLEIKKIKEFQRYYRKVSQFMPFLPEAHAMAGFCYFYDGEIAKAQRAYQVAVDVYPKVFNFHYNLGLIALKRNDFPAALEYFKKSVAVAPIENIQFILVSRIYQPFLPFAHQPQALATEMGEHTKEFYRQAYLRILEISQTIGDYQTMLKYSRLAMASGVLEKSIVYFYTGCAAYELKEYRDAGAYLQEAVKHGFYYAQGFRMIGLCLQALGKPESRSAFASALSLTKDGKVFVPEKLKGELLIY